MRAMRSPRRAMATPYGYDSPSMHRIEYTGAHGGVRDRSLVEACLAVAAADAPATAAPDAPPAGATAYAGDHHHGTGVAAPAAVASAPAYVPPVSLGGSSCWCCCNRSDPWPGVTTDVKRDDAKHQRESVEHVVSALADGLLTMLTRMQAALVVASAAAQAGLS